MSIRKRVQAIPLLVSVAVLMPLACAGVPGSQAQQGAGTNYSGINVESSEQVFATMCALDAAGFGADESTLAEMPARLKLRADLLKMQGPATEALRRFYHDHELADPGETLSRYMAFSLVVGPPPRFEFVVDRDLLPPDVLAIDGFQELLANYYLESHLESRWALVEPEYDRAIARYQSAVRRIVMVSNGYLREILKPRYGRTFTVYVEPLVGNRTNFRNTGDRYAVVVGTGSQVPLDDIRHAYLHFLLDPLPLQYRKDVENKSALLNIAARAPRLPVEYKNDFLALTDECLIKAVELRLNKPSPEQLERSLADDDFTGFILVRPFVAQLQKFEKAEPAMSSYYPDLIADIDVQAEQKRLQNVTFGAAGPAPGSKEGGAPAGAQPSELDSWLAEGDRRIALRDASGAEETFKRVLGKYPKQPRAIYGLALASVLEGKADRAKELFEILVAPAPPGESVEALDATVVAWSHVYLGRIHDLEDERELAVSEYHAALAVEGAPEIARVAAQHGLDSSYKAPVPEKGSATQKP